MQNRSGTALKGYELRERIGTGGFGAVYRAFQSTVGREVAIKIILPSHANKPEFIRRFEAEAQIVTFLKIGRVSFMYQTMDGEDSYFWNKVERKWRPLDDSYNKQLRMAIRMARDQIPSNLLFIPVNAPDNL